MKLEFLAAGSPDCPLIRLYEFSRAEALSLRELVKSLSSGSRENISLSEQPWIESVKNCHLTLRFGDGGQGIRKSTASTFECVLNADEWSDVEWLLEPFCESEPTGFQWLCRKGETSLLLSQDGRW
jgi:hypothetical protein